MDRRETAIRRLLSQDAVRAMHQRQAKRVADKLARCMPTTGRMGKRTPDLARRALVAMIHNRCEPSDNEFKELIAEGQQGLREAISENEPAFTLKEIKRWIKKTGDRSYTSRAEEVFKGRNRLYMPLLEREKSRTEKKVEAWLTENGYTDIAYEEGYAVDDKKQRRRIGRVLRAAGESDLFEAFTKDNGRAAARQMVVISRHPYDLLRMSTLRGWQSCMAKGGMYWDEVPKDLREGSLIAYLVSENDPNINDPMSRILLKPYRNADGQLAWKANDTYGMGHEGFEKTVAEFTDAVLNHGKYGQFKLAKVYCDGAPDNMRRLPQDCRGIDAEAFLKMVDADYEKDEKTGKLTVTHDADWSEMGLTHLPDLTNVHFEEDLILKENPLVSLKGCPKRVDGHFNVAETKLANLQGAPQHVGRDFICDKTRLDDLRGAPRHVGGDFDAEECGLKSLRGAPRKIGGRLYIRENELVDFSGGPSEVGGDIQASNNKLTSLKGFPKVAGEDVDLRENRLKTLEGLPLTLPGHLLLDNNQLRSLKGAPIRVDGNFKASDNKLINLDGAPLRVKGRFCVNRNRLTSLQGGPEVVYDRYEVDDNEISDLTGAPAWCGSGFSAANNRISNLAPLPRIISGDLNLSKNRIFSLDGAPNTVNGDCNLHHNLLRDLTGDLLIVSGTLAVDDNPMVNLHGPLASFGRLFSPFGNFRRFEDIPEKLTNRLATSRPHSRLAEYEAAMAAKAAAAEDDGDFKPAAPFRP